MGSGLLRLVVGPLNSQKLAWAIIKVQIIGHNVCYDVYTMEA